MSLLGGDVLNETTVGVVDALMLAERVDPDSQRRDGLGQRLAGQLFVASRESVEQNPA